MRITTSVFCFIVLLTGELFALANGDFRSKQSGNWNSAATWEVYIGSWITATTAPTSADGQITILNTHTVTIPNVNITADQIVVQAGGALTISFGGLIMNDVIGEELTVNGTLNLAGNISGTGTFIINGTMNWISGAIEGNAERIISSGAVLNMLGGDKYFQDGILSNSGVINIESGYLQLKGTARFNNLSSGIIDIKSAGGITNTVSGTEVLNNSGILRKTTNTEDAVIYPILNNTGIIEVQTGILRLHSPSASIGGTISISAGASLRHSEGIHNLVNGLNITGNGTYAVNSPVTIEGTTPGLVLPSTITLSLGSYIRGTGILTINGTMNWISGAIEGNAERIISSGAVLNMLGGDKYFQDGILSNSGVINIESGYLQLKGTARFNNLSSGIIDIKSAGGITNTVSGTEVLNNSGILRKTTNTEDAVIYPILNNTGTIEVQTGILRLHSPSASIGGTISISAGASLRHSEGIHNLVNGLNITGNGIYSIAGGEIILNGTTPGTSVSSFATFLLTTGGTLRGTGTLTVNGIMNWTGGNIRDDGTRIINTGGVLNIIGPNCYFYNGIISNSGTINWVSNPFYMYSNARINNTSTGLFDISCDQVVYLDAGTASIINAGLFRKRGETGTTDLRATFTNTGTILVENGILHMSTLTNFSGTTLSGGTYHIKGTLRFLNANIRTLAATIILDGASSQLQHNTGANALASLATINSSGIFRLRNGRNHTVEGTTVLGNYGIVDCEANYINGNRFVNGFSGTLICGSPDGLRITTRLLGNIRTQSASFDNQGTYIFTAQAAQVTGNAFPNQIKNLIIDNPAGVTLSIPVTIIGTLTLTNGELNNSSQSVTISTNYTVSRSGGSLTAPPVFTSTVNLEYTGTSSITTGYEVPASASALKDLTMNCSGSLILNSNVNVNGVLNLAGGNIQTGTFTLTVGSGVTSTGSVTRTSGAVTGNLKRWFAAAAVNDVIFPVGTSSNYRPAGISFTSAPTSGGTITSFFTASDPTSSGLPKFCGTAEITKCAGDGYWTLTPGDGLSDGTYKLELTAEGFSGITNYSTLRILKRSTGGLWMIEGDHLPGGGTNQCPVIRRNNLSSFSEFGIGSGADNPLPVELTSFTAIVKDNAVNLKWETATELNNYGFEIERSQYEMIHILKDWRISQKSEIRNQLPEWETIGFVKGAGNSNSTKEYMFVNRPDVYGEYKYRIKQVDNNGTFSYSDEIKVIVGTLPAEFELKTYPNPFNPSTTVLLEIPQSSKVNLSVYSIIGERVAELFEGVLEAGLYRAVFDAANLASGIYIMILNSDKDVQLVKKIMLMK